MDQAKIKAFRQDVAKQLDGIKRVTDTLAGDDATLKAGIGKIDSQIDQYAKQADSAIDLSSVDPNTGIAAMQ